MTDREDVYRGKIAQAVLAVVAEMSAADRAAFNAALDAIRDASQWLDEQE